MLETTKIEVKVIPMPSIEDVKRVSEINHQRVLAEKQKEQEEFFQKCELNKQRALADLPNIIEFINKKIEKSCLEGRKSVYFSIDDTHSSQKHDERCEYIVPGMVGYEFFDRLNEIYSSLGFNSECKNINCWGPTAYREGEIYIHW